MPPIKRGPYKQYLTDPTTPMARTTAWRRKKNTQRKAAPVARQGDQSMAEEAVTTDDEALPNSPATIKKPAEKRLARKRRRSQEAKPDNPASLKPKRKWQDDHPLAPKQKKEEDSFKLSPETSDSAPETSDSAPETSDSEGAFYVKEDSVHKLRARTAWLLLRELNSLRVAKVFAETDLEDLKTELAGLRKDLQALRNEEVETLKNEVKQLNSELRLLASKYDSSSSCKTEEATTSLKPELPKPVGGKGSCSCSLAQKEETSTSNGSTGSKLGNCDREAEGSSAAKTRRSFGNDSSENDTDSLAMVPIEKGPTRPSPIKDTVKKRKEQSSSSKGTKKKLLRAPPVYKEEETFRFGSVVLPGKRLNLCNHTGKVSALAVDILLAIFTPKELALCSLTGKVPNGHKQLVKKEKLDPERMAALIDYIKTFLKGEMNDEEVTEKVNTAVAYKLNNFLKTDTAKRIILEEYNRQQQFLQEQQQVPAATGAVMSTDGSFLLLLQPEY